MKDSYVDGFQTATIVRIWLTLAEFIPMLLLMLEPITLFGFLTKDRLKRITTVPPLSVVCPQKGGLLSSTLPNEAVNIICRQ